MPPISRWLAGLGARCDKVAQAFQSSSDRYLAYLKIEKHQSPATIKTYQTVLNNCREHFGDCPIEDWGQSGQDAPKRLLIFLRKRMLSSASIALYFSVIKTFYHFSTGKRLSWGQKTSGLALPKPKQRLPSTLEMDQIFQLLGFEAKNWIEIRDKAILELLYSTGIRLSEAVTLTVSCFHPEAAMVMVSGKGGKERWVPLGSYALQALECWLRVREQHSPAHEYCFIAKGGAALSPRAIQKRVAFWAQRQLNVHLHPHQLRHTFATHLLGSSQNLRAVQACLGHSSLTSTQRYTQLDYLHLTQVYDRCHPRQKSQDDVDTIPELK